MRAIEQNKVVVFGNACGHGGAQTAFRRLVEVLVKDGFNVGAVGLVRLEDEMFRGEDLAFSCRIQMDSSRLRKACGTLDAAWKCRRFAPHCFVSVGLARSSTFLARCLSSSSYCVAQDFIFGRRLDDPLLLSCFGAFDALAVQSPSMIEPLVSQGFDRLPLSWLPCFPDPPMNTSSEIPRRLTQGLRLAYFGRLAANKGLDLLFAALCSSASKTCLNLDVWGDGSERGNLEDLNAKLGLDRCVAFRGRYPGGLEQARLLGEYDGIVLPSTGAEGLPLILLEAMACGVPFLTTNVGAITDCCDGNQDCLLVLPEVDALREGIDRFADSLRGGQFSRERLRSYFETHYSPEVMTKRWRLMLEDPSGFFSSHA